MAEKTVKKTTTVKKTAPAKEVAGLSIPVYGMDGKESGTVALSEELFTVEASPRLVAQYVRVYLANQRQGTASTKHRSEVKGTTKKVYKQKGTGNARHGSMKAPLFVGGGVDSGPKPTDHSLQMNKKQKRKALFSTLSAKVKHNALAAIGKDVVGMTPKTSAFVTLLKALGAETKKVMIVVSQKEEGMRLSVRNLKKVEMVSTSNLNAYNVIYSDRVLFSEEALTQLSSIYQKK